MDGVVRCNLVHNYDRSRNNDPNDIKHINHKVRTRERNVVCHSCSSVEPEWVWWNSVFIIDVYTVSGCNQSGRKQSTSDDGRPHMDICLRCFVILNHNDSLVIDSNHNEPLVIHVHRSDGRNKLYVHGHISQLERTRRSCYFVPGNSHTSGRRHKLGRRDGNSCVHAAHMDGVSERNPVYNHDVSRDDDSNDGRNVNHKDESEPRCIVHVLRLGDQRVRRRRDVFGPKDYALAGRDKLRDDQPTTYHHGSHVDGRTRCGELLDRVFAGHDDTTSTVWWCIHIYKSDGRHPVHIHDFVREFERNG